MAKSHQLGTGKPSRSGPTKSRIKNAGKSGKGQPKAKGAGPGKAHEIVMTSPTNAIYGGQ